MRRCLASGQLPLVCPQLRGVHSGQGVSVGDGISPTEMQHILCCVFFVRGGNTDIGGIVSPDPKGVGRSLQFIIAEDNQSGILHDTLDKKMNSSCDDTSVTLTYRSWS